MAEANILQQIIQKLGHLFNPPEVQAPDLPEESPNRIPTSINRSGSGFDVAYPNGQTIRVGEKDLGTVAGVNNYLKNNKIQGNSPVTEQKYTPGNVLKGFKNKIPEQKYLDLIMNSSKKYDIPPELIAAVIQQESGFNPNALNPGDATSGRDRGMVQINEKAFPNITDQQAFDPNFAIPFAAEKLAGDIDYFGGDINRGIAAYNVGRGGANVKGPEPFGGGPKGQRYIDNVSRNLDPSVIEALKILRSRE